jgi:hypothetical protein
MSADRLDRRRCVGPRGALSSALDVPRLRMLSPLPTAEDLPRNGSDGARREAGEASGAGRRSG